MAFFGNDAVNRVNLHFVIQAFAANAGGIFLLVFLMQRGFSPAAALSVLAGLIGLRFVMRPLILPIGLKWGLKPLLIAGVLGTALQYPLLAMVHGLTPSFWVWIAVSSAASTLYWPTYHAYFSSLGDAEHRGQQVGIREAASTVITIAAPLVGGWLLVKSGPLWTFCVCGVVQALSALPLLAAPNVMPPRKAAGIVRAARAGVTMMLVDGWQGACIYYVWQAALFISLGASIGAYAGATALAALVGALLTLLFGRHIDQGGGRRTAAMACVATTALVLVQAAAVGNLWLAVGANALVALVNALVIPAISTPLYNLAQASPCAFRYNIAAEGAWDVGCGSGILVAAGVSALGGSFSIAILTALPVVAALFWILWRYYGAHPTAGGVEIEPELAVEPHLP